MRTVLVIVLVGILTATLACAEPAIETVIARGLMFNRQLANEDTAYGTRKVLLRGKLSLFSAKDGVTSANRDTTVFIPCAEQLSKSSLTGLSNVARGLIVQVCDANPHNEVQLALLFSSSTLPNPVYFVKEDDPSLHDLLRTTTDPISLSVGRSQRLTEPYPNRSVAVHHIYAQLRFKSKEVNSKGSTAPRVLVTANFDTLGVAPSLPSTGSSSGVAVAIDLWRRFTVATSEVRNDQAPYALMFHLGSSARLNYGGTAAWLAERPDAEVDRLRLVVSIDDLMPVGEDETLYMHVQDSLMRHTDGKHLVALAEQTAAAMGIVLKVQPARTNYQHYDLRFEHEVFANRQLPAVTFSAVRSYSNDQLFRDIRRPLPRASDAPEVLLLQRRVAMIEAFIRTLVDLPATAVPEVAAEERASRAYLLGHLHYAASIIRSPVTKSGELLKVYANSVEQHLRVVSSDLRLANPLAVSSVSSSARQLPLNALVVFGPYDEVLRAYVGKPLPVELGIAALVLLAVGTFGFVEFGASGLKSVLIG